MQSSMPRLNAGSNTNLSVTMRLRKNFSLPQSTQIQIYRIAQEALSNICRHANAKRVKMSAGIAAGNQFELQY